MKYSDLLEVTAQLRKCAEFITNKSEIHEHPAVLAAAETGDDDLLFTVATSLVKAEYELLQTVNRLESLATKADADIKNNDIENLAAIAEAYENSEDESLKKQAAVIDQLLLNFAQQGELYKAKMAQESEIQKLRQKYKDVGEERSYRDPSKEHEKDIKAQDAIKAIQDQVVVRRPLEASLRTRYCPDHPGCGLIRIGEDVFQCSLDKTIFNYAEGYKTLAGEVVPGGSVADQTQRLGDRRLEKTNFSTREGELAQR